MTNSPKSQVNIYEALEMLKKNILYSLNCLNIGKIISFNAQNQTAEIELMQVKEFGGNFYSNTVLSEVPVFIYGTADAQITLPDLTGTICLVLTFDRNIDAFMQTGESYHPSTARVHNLTDSIALTTFFSFNKPVQNYDTEAITLIYNKIIEEIIYISFIKNTGNTVVLQTKSEEEQDGETVVNISTLNVTPAAITGSTSTGGKIELTEKINIQNSTQNLAVLIQNFIAACESITTVNGGALTPASKQLFTDLKTQFEGLLI